MKRAMMSFLAAGLLLSMTSGARAADVNIKGQWQNGFSWADRNPLKSANASVDRFKASIRLRTQIDIVASDSLKGVVFFEVGHQNWGTNDAALGTDGKVVKVRYSYVDWNIPETDAKVRMGLQPFDIATFAVPYAAFMTDGAGISLSGNFTENVGATLFWVRAYNNDERTVSVYDKDNTLLYTYNSHDAMDVIGLAVPVQFDGIRMNPSECTARSVKTPVSVPVRTTRPESPADCFPLAPGRLSPTPKTITATHGGAAFPLK